MEYGRFISRASGSKAGHHVRIAAASFSHVSQANSRSEWTVSVQREKIENVEYVWLRTHRAMDQTVPSGFWNMLVFCSSRLFLERGQSHADFKPDLVINVFNISDGYFPGSLSRA